MPKALIFATIILPSIILVVWVSYIALVCGGMPDYLGLIEGPACLQ